MGRGELRIKLDGLSQGPLLRQGTALGDFVLVQTYDEITHITYQAIHHLKYPKHITNIRSFIGIVIEISHISYLVIRRLPTLETILTLLKQSNCII